MTEELYFCIRTTNDYREGPNVDVKIYQTCEELEARENTFVLYEVMCSSINVKKYTVIIGGGHDVTSEEPILQKEFEILEEAKDLLIQTYSHVNNHGPFIVTGLTCAYKHIGDYAKAVLVTDVDVKKIQSENLCVLFGFIVGPSKYSSDTEILETLSIKPCG